MNPMDEPREQNEEPLTPDLTIVSRAGVDRSNYCYMRRNDTLEQPLFIPDSRAGVSWKQALIAAFRIVGAQGGEFPHRPEVSLLLMANAFGRPLGVWQGTLPNPPVRKLHGLKPFGTTFTSRQGIAAPSSTVPRRRQHTSRIPPPVATGSAQTASARLTCGRARGRTGVPASLQ